MLSYLKALQKVAKATQRMPNRAAIEAVNFSKERFVQKNWLDTNRKPWEPTKRKVKRGSLMVRSGRLKRSIRKLAFGNNWILIGTDVPYAELHNEGGTIKETVTVKTHKRTISRGRNTGKQATVQSHKRQMNIKVPPRKFIGDSAILGRRIERLIERDLKDALK